MAMNVRVDDNANAIVKQGHCPPTPGALDDTGYRPGGPDVSQSIAAVMIAAWGALSYDR